MAEDAESGREAREYAVLVRALVVVMGDVSLDDQPDDTYKGWRELGTVEALNRRGAKDAALVRWPEEMTPANGREVVAQFVPARSWQAAIGKHDQAPAPPPKISWEGL